MLHRVTFILRAYDPVGPTLDALDASPAPPDGASVERGEHLVWWVVTRGDELEARYVFDEVYARAHPESLDPAHLAMLHALITFKLFDDAQVLIPPRQLAGVLRWPGLDERRRPLVRPPES